ncbi:hypothetical protein [Streptomyces sp. NPDC003688]
MSASYSPLRKAEYGPSFPGSVDRELAATRRILDETASLNIHSHDEMLRAAVALDCRVRGLVAALDAERGERR